MLTPERLDVARELHDGIAQDLVALGYSLDLLLAVASRLLVKSYAMPSCTLGLAELE